MASLHISTSTSVTIKHRFCVASQAHCQARAPACRAISQSTSCDAHVPSPSSRRALMGAIVALAVAAAPLPALAFGTGFPGYDVNVEGRKRALERNKREMEAERQRAAAWRAARDAKLASKAAAEAQSAAQ